MTKNEIQFFIEEMESIGDLWTEEQVKECYGDLPLHQALDLRRSEVWQHLTNLGRFITYSQPEEKMENP